MVITTGKNEFANTEFCKLNQDTLEESLKLYNHMTVRLFFQNPIGLQLYLTVDNFTMESGVTVTSVYSNVSSELIKEHILGIFN